MKHTLVPRFNQARSAEPCAARTMCIELAEQAVRARKAGSPREPGTHRRTWRWKGPIDGGFFRCPMPVSSQESVSSLFSLPPSLPPSLPALFFLLLFGTKVPRHGCPRRPPTAPGYAVSLITDKDAHALRGIIEVMRRTNQA